MSKHELSRLLALFQATYPHHPVPDPEALLFAWELGMGDVPYGAAIEAATAWVRSGERFFPSPGQIRELVIDETGAFPSGGDAWAMVLRRIKTTYPGHPAPPWDAPEPVRQAVGAMGGTEPIRRSENPGADRSQFLKLYETYRQRAARAADVAELVEAARAEKLGEQRGQAPAIAG